MLVLYEIHGFSDVGRAVGVWIGAALPKPEAIKRGWYFLGLSGCHSVAVYIGMGPEPNALPRVGGHIAAVITRETAERGLLHLLSKLTNIRRSDLPGWFWVSR